MKKKHLSTSFQRVVFSFALTNFSYGYLYVDWDELHSFGATQFFLIEFENDLVEKHDILYASTLFLFIVFIVFSRFSLSLSLFSLFNEKFGLPHHIIRKHDVIWWCCWWSNYRIIIKTMPSWCTNKECNPLDIMKFEIKNQLKEKFCLILELRA